MIRPLLHSIIRRFEKRYAYDATYMHEIADTSVGAFMKLGLAQAMNTHREGVPLDALFAARITAVRFEDCGPCAQLVVNMALEAGVAGGPDAVRVKARAGRFGHLHADLGADHDLVAVLRQPRRQRPLRRAVAVHVGGVDERAAGIEEAVEDPVGFVDWCGPAHQHRAEAEPADGQRPERRRLHAGSKLSDDPVTVPPCVAALSPRYSP